VARSTRQQRRQRRAQQQPALAGGPPSRPPLRPVAQGDEPTPRRERRDERREEVRPGVPGIRFFQESVAELKKVEWPNRDGVISGTAVVLIACIIVGVYLWGNDEVWKYVVQHVLLR
jgi:preprotein translocase subunit SecE